MRITLRELRELIRAECISKPYDHDLKDDESYKKRSVYVSDDIKDQIDDWMHKMKLQTTSRRRRAK